MKLYATVTIWARDGDRQTRLGIRLAGSTAEAVGLALNEGEACRRDGWTLVGLPMAVSPSDEQMSAVSVTPDVISPLAVERATYFAHKAELLDGYEGEYVLIKGENIVGTYTTYDAALAAGYAAFGTGGFMVHQILAVEPAVRI